MIKKLFYFSLFLVVFEGVMRKWLMPSLSTPIFVLKYFVVILLWVAFMISDHSKHLKKKDYPYFLLAMLFFIYIILNYFISYFSLKVWLVGILVYFGFMIYIFVVPFIIKDKATLDKFITYVIYVSFIVFLVGFIQYFLPPSHPLNTYAAKDVESIALSAGAVRITSIFNYITGSSTFLSFSVPLVFMFSITEKSIRKKIIFIVLLLLGLFDIFATGSRLGVFFVLFAMASILLFILFVRGNFSDVIRFSNNVLLLVIILIILNITDLLHLEAFYTFIERASSTTDSSTGRVLWMLMSIIPAFEYAGVGGFGVGSTHQISVALGESLLDISNTEHFGDQPMGRIIVEIGLLGFILYLVFLIAIAWDLIKKVFTIHNKHYRYLAFTLFSTLLQYFLIMNNIIFNWMGAVHFWLSVGFIIAIKRLDKKEKIIGKSIYD